jgi:O-antigen ligase
MFSVPFLVPLHGAPVASFPSEWWSLLLGTVLLLATALQRAPLPATFPVISWTPLLLAALLLLQWLQGRLAYGASAVLAGSCLLWAALLAWAGRAAVQRHGSVALCQWLACWLLAGGLLNAIAGLLQFAGAWPMLGGWVATPAAEAHEGIYGNLAQQNHFATHLALAIASACWLCQQGRLAARWCAAALLPLLVALALSGSRSGWLYLLLTGALLLRQARHLDRRLLLALPLLLAVAVAAWFNLLGPQMARLTHLTAPFGPRAFAWQHAWQMALAHPLAGVGWDNFAATLVEQLQAGEQVWGIDQYAHNLPLQLLAAGGIPALLALLLPAARQWQQARQATAWSWLVLGIVLIHSLLEQPLYYAYFLGPVAFVAGALSEGTTRPAGAALRWGTAAGALLLLFGLVRTLRNYDDIANQVYQAEQPASGAALQRLHQASLFAPLLELALPGEFVSPTAPVAQRLAFNARVRHFAPVAEVEFRHAALLAEAGQQEAAQQQLVRAARAYPTETPEYLQRIIMLGQQDPATYGVLARFAAARSDWR